MPSDIIHFVTIDGRRFLGYPRSDVRKGYAILADALRASSELARAYPNYSWGVE